MRHSALAVADSSSILPLWTNTWHSISRITGALSAPVTFRAHKLWLRWVLPHDNIPLFTRLMLLPSTTLLLPIAIESWTARFVRIRSRARRQLLCISNPVVMRSIVIKSQQPSTNSTSSHKSLWTVVSEVQPNHPLASLLFPPTNVLSMAANMSVISVTQLSRRLIAWINTWTLPLMMNSSSDALTADRSFSLFRDWSNTLKASLVGLLGSSRL